MALSILLRDMKELQARLDNGDELQTGLCSTLDLYWFPHVQSMMAEWPESSGVPDFPVPAPAGYVRRHNSYPTVHEDQYWNKRNWSAEYRASRRRLLDYLILRVAADLREPSATAPH